MSANRDGEGHAVAAFCNLNQKQTVMGGRKSSSSVPKPAMFRPCRFIWPRSSERARGACLGEHGLFRSASRLSASDPNDLTAGGVLEQQVELAR